MLEYLAHLDTVLMHFINVSLANPVTDFLMPLVTDDIFLRSLYAVALVIILWKGDRRLRWIVLFSILTLALTDSSVNVYLKHWFNRIRPCHTLTDLRVLVDCGAGLSMPSSHAANSFGQAMLFAVAYPKTRWGLVGFAAMVALSRVFVGVHYPFDVLVGALVGALIGFIVAKIFQRLFPVRS